MKVFHVSIEHVLSPGEAAIEFDIEQANPEAVEHLVNRMLDRRHYRVLRVEEVES